MKRALIVAAILVFVAGALIYAYPRTETTEYTEVTAGESGVIGTSGDGRTDADALVVFDGEQFAPKELTVPKGSSVRFLNESDTGVWPASAIHPTHSLYPGKSAADCLGSSFDSCRPLTQGEYFEFIFDYAGEWRYHDHVEAYKTGIITVTE